ASGVQDPNSCPSFGMR
ncbi:hypothetical protein D020_2164B, partial [Vibrio parahaemolyticus SBR10290]